MGIKFFAVAIAVFASAFTLCGQTAAVADLQQDMALLKREVGQLRLEVEQLRRENEELLRKIKQSSNDDNENVKQQLSFAKSEISAQNEKGIVCGVGKRVCGTERKQTSAKQRTGRRLCVVDAIPVVVEAKPCGSERFLREMKAPAIAKL